jgi:hypothetical protein
LRVLVFTLTICLAIYALSFYAHAQSTLANTSEIDIQIVSPEEGTTIISKKPIVQCRMAGQVSPENILVLFDGIDVTGIVDFTPEGFTYKPIQVIPPGMHSLTVMITEQNGQEVSHEFAFSSRHSEKLEEAYSANEISAVYEGVIEKPEDVHHVPNSNFEANLNTMNKIKEKQWEVSFNANLRFLDKSISVLDPEKKGLTLIDALLQAKYTDTDLYFLAEAGDIYINETQATVQGLARKGGRLSFGYKDVALNAFVVNGLQTFGYRVFTDDLGIEGRTDDHIMGASGQINLFSERVKFKTIYVKGGEPTDSFGISSIGGNRQGEVLGFALMTEIISQKLAVDAEIDFSKFDQDTTDEFPSEDDKSYNIRASGNAGQFNYSALYEYVGPEYEVVGNMGFPKDREGFLLTAGANFRYHSINLLFSRYNDNVKLDDLYPRATTYQGSIDYAFTKFQSLPMGINYQKSTLDTSHEPEFTSPVKTDTDVITARINYIKRPFNFGFHASYSLQNDRTPSDNDTSSQTYTFIPAYYGEHISIAPCFSYNSSKFDFSDVRIDTYTANLDIRGDLFVRKFTYAFAGTYNTTKSSDDMTDSDTYNLNLTLQYLLARNLWGFLNPSVGIRGQYYKTDDRVYGNKNEELIIMAVLSLSMPFTF